MWAVAQKLDSTDFSNPRERIGKALLSKRSNQKEKDGTAKVSKMMTAHDDKKSPNAQEKIAGKDIPPGLLGCFPHRALGVTANRPELIDELNFRHVECDNKLGPRILQGILQEAEQSGLPKELSSESLDRGFHSDGMKITSMIVLAKHDYAEKSQSTGGKRSVDFGKFFLKLCQDLDETIFEADD
jgi:hypothetical protein